MYLRQSVISNGLIKLTYLPWRSRSHETEFCCACKLQINPITVLHSRGHTHRQAEFIYTYDIISLVRMNISDLMMLKRQSSKNFNNSMKLAMTFVLLFISAVLAFSLPSTRPSPSLFPVLNSSHSLPSYTKCPLGTMVRYLSSLKLL